MISLPLLCLWFVCFLTMHLFLSNTIVIPKSTHLPVLYFLGGHSFSPDVLCRRFFCASFLFELCLSPAGSPLRIYYSPVEFESPLFSSISLSLVALYSPQKSLSAFISYHNHFCGILGPKIGSSVFKSLQSRLDVDFNLHISELKKV